MVVVISLAFFVFFSGVKFFFGLFQPNTDWIQPQNIFIVIAFLGYLFLGGAVRSYMLVELGGFTEEYIQKRERNFDFLLWYILGSWVAFFAAPVIYMAGNTELAGWIYIGCIINTILFIVGMQLAEYFDQPKDKREFSFKEVPTLFMTLT